jgi:L-lactate dehydrogenase complex protein LldE
MKVDIFIPCFIDQVYPQTAFNMVKILEKLDVEVHYNENQTCCGQISFNSGFWDDAKTLGEKFIKDFNTGRTVVTPSASCGGYVKNYYGELFHNTGMHLEFKQLQKNMMEITDFLVNVMHITDLGATFEHKVTYHDSCASLREYKLKDEPRSLLSHVKGLELVEMAERDVCCGFGGTFSVKNQGISSAMAEQKVQNAIATGAEYIISTDASCLMHQAGYISKHKLPLKVMHIVDVLASGW